MDTDKNIESPEARLSRRSSEAEADSDKWSGIREIEYLFGVI
jgi:hypothetical protein